jgi:hypothetical protein
MIADISILEGLQAEQHSRIGSSLAVFNSKVRNEDKKEELENEDDEDMENEDAKDEKKSTENEDDKETENEDDDKKVANGFGTAVSSGKDKAANLRKRD